MEENLTNDESMAGTAVEEKQTKATPAADAQWAVDVPNEVDIESENASHSNADGQGTDTSTSTIDVTFWDFSAQPIDGLKYKFVVGDKTVSGVTDGSGKAGQLVDIAPGSDVEIHVFRDHTKDFKCVGTLLAHSGWVGYTVVSPKLKFEIETEPHDGEPGQAEENMPPTPSKSENESSQSSNTAKPQEEKKEADSTTAKPAPQAQASAKPGTPPPASAQSKSPTPAQPSVTPGRDSRGNPQATVQDSTVDWLKRKILSVFNFWTWADFQKPQRLKSPDAEETKKETKVTTKQKKADQPASQPSQEVTKGHASVNPLAAPAASEKLTDAELVRLQKLITFVENQVLQDYSPYKSGHMPTLAVLNEYKKSDSPSFGAKPAGKSIGLCQPYVKIALFKSGYTSGPGNESHAKTSGKDWMAYGFADISNQLPPIDITYQNAIAPKDIPKATDVAKKRGSLKRLKEQRRKQGKPMSAEECAAAEKEIPAMPDTTAVVYKQPDLMYTVPGDVIVYEQVDPIEEDMAGHVDIRTYHGFASDFVWPRLPSLGGPAKPTKRYRVIGVYRKASDTFAMMRVKAFLKLLRERETKGFSEREAYFALPDTKGSNGKCLKRKFTDVSIHPFSDEAKEHFSNIDINGNANTSAGAYQTKVATWGEVIKETGWPKTFDSEMQDRIALVLLQHRNNKINHPKRTALGYIMEGKVEEAIKEARLYEEWAVLPGASKTYTIEDMKDDFEKYLKEFKK